MIVSAIKLYKTSPDVSGWVYFNLFQLADAKASPRFKKLKYPTKYSISKNLTVFLQTLYKIIVHLALVKIINYLK